MRSAWRKQNQKIFDVNCHWVKPTLETQPHRHNENSFHSLIRILCANRLHTKR